MAESMLCPECGHELSMFSESDPEPGERRAARIADLVASWRFPVAILVIVFTWLAVNVVARPFEPHPTVALATVSAVLATAAACQGPLILLTQRRAAIRDRERDREIFRIAANTEVDLHRLQAALDALLAPGGSNEHGEHGTH